MKKVVALTLAGSILLASCAEPYRPSQSTYEGGLIGAVTGATAGAILTSGNKWKGGVIGGVIGAIAGATIAEISKRGAVEAVQSGQPVRYQTEDGRGVYEAKPLGYDAKTRCHKVQEKIYENGKLVKDQIKEVCESEKVEQKY
ncbi:YMGG-like glycine zipper-containing protein [Sulfurihydrogenibium subterraneum]|uniref:YMGG-like glycine zipper-containing protein n=1 Tax=Sulfurihydrogenibium subterraneum TaxID=171121 RepID=UPI00048C6EAA|nr:YMGG-like glycine zipper-containing protein [Sulfurihydrogenibium subterraneum]